MIMVSFPVAASISDAMPSLIPYFAPIMIVPQVFRMSLPAFKPRRRCAGISSFNTNTGLEVLREAAGQTAVISYEELAELSSFNTCGKYKCVAIGV